MAIAAVSLTLFSLLGIGAITGIIPSAKSARLETTAAAVPAPSVVQPAPSEPPKATASQSARPSAPAARQNASSGTRMAARDSKASDASACAHCGRVAAINLVKHDGEATGLGAVAGGVAGGLVGNQVGKGRGNILMTVLGAGGGAYAGHTIEKKVKASTAYVVKVHMNDGSTRTVTMADKPEFAVGDQVKVINGRISVIS
jgi:outer membrane lipoprotein SlyB